MKFDKQKFISWVTKETDYEALKVKTTNAFSGWDLRDPSGVFEKVEDVTEIIEQVVFLIEKYARFVDSLSSREKQDMVVEFIDDLVTFHMFLEWFDDKAIRLVVSSVVALKNKWFGKNWFDAENEIN